MFYRLILLCPFTLIEIAWDPCSGLGLLDGLGPQLTSAVSALFSGNLVCNAIDRYNALCIPLFV